MVIWRILSSSLQIVSGQGWDGYEAGMGHWQHLHWASRRAIHPLNHCPYPVSAMDLAPPTGKGMASEA